MTPKVLSRDMLGAPGTARHRRVFMHESATLFRKGQSNFDQAIVDMQISLFAYCKSLRKVLVEG